MSKTARMMMMVLELNCPAIPWQVNRLAFSCPSAHRYAGTLSKMINIDAYIDELAVQLEKELKYVSYAAMPRSGVFARLCPDSFIV
jgi:hypothetical protein